MKHQPTSTQPQPAKTRIYGSTPVTPLETASDQPQVLPHITVRGVKTKQTIRVTLKRGKRELVIAESDFDPDRHKLVSE